MRRDWEPEDLVASWTLVEQDERELVAYKRGATRLGFALMLKFFEIEARFPRHASEFPPAAVAYVARTRRNTRPRLLERRRLNRKQNSFR